jgi:hypothetical protein
MENYSSSEIFSARWQSSTKILAEQDKKFVPAISPML